VKRRKHGLPCLLFLGGGGRVAVKGEAEVVVGVTAKKKRDRVSEVGQRGGGGETRAVMGEGGEFAYLVPATEERLGAAKEVILSRVTSSFRPWLSPSQLRRKEKVSSPLGSLESLTSPTIGESSLN